MFVAAKTVGAFAGGFMLSYGTSGDLKAATQHGCLIAGGFLIGHVFPQQSTQPTGVKS